MADLSIDSAVGMSTARGFRAVVFTTALIGYWFYIDTNGNFVYSKTTNGGSSWGAAVVISSDTATLAFDVWFDKWTPGDSGTVIHTWYFNSTVDDALYRPLDTATDTLGTARVVFAGASTVTGVGIFISGTKTRSGYLYCAYDLDAGAEKGLHRSTDGGPTWSASLSATFVEATQDRALLFPASNTGDNNDCWALYQDVDVNALTLKMWDSSAGSATESSTIQTIVETGADLAQQYAFSGSVRHSDGHLIIASLSERDAATGDHQVWDINGTASITAKTAITTNIDDHYHPSVFIDQLTDDIYIAYVGKRDGSEALGSAAKVYYTKSTDGGTSWSAGDTTYMDDAVTSAIPTWAPLMGERFIVGWTTGGTNLRTNFVNSIDLASAGGPIFVTVNQVTEADIAQAIAWAPKRRLVGQAAETELAQALSERKTKSLGQAIETDASQAIAHRKAKAVVQAAETDLAQGVTRNKVRAIAQASETDLAQAATHRKTKAIAQASASDVAQPVAWAPKRRLVNQANETDLAQTLTRRKARTLAQSAETDLAQAVTRGPNAHNVAVNQAAETDLAQPVARRKLKAIAQAAESDAAQAISRRKTRPLGQAAEVDIGQPVARLKRKALAQATETDLAQALTRRKTRTVTQASETDTGQGLAHRKAKLIGQAVEIDTAQLVTHAGNAHLVAVNQATEVDSVQPLVRRKVKAIAQAVEADLAQAVVRRKRKAIGQAVETNSAQAIARRKSRTLGQTNEVDIVFPLARRKTQFVGRAVEIDVALPVIVVGGHLFIVEDHIIGMLGGSRVFVIPGGGRAVGMDGESRIVALEGGRRVFGAEADPRTLGAE